jgi:hypothetical protein
VSKSKYDELCSGVGEVPVAVPRVVAPVAVAKREVTNVVKNKKGTKISQVVEMIASNPQRSNKALMIADIMNMLGVSKGNASIYYTKALALV